MHHWQRQLLTSYLVYLELFQPNILLWLILSHQKRLYYQAEEFHYLMKHYFVHHTNRIERYMLDQLRAQNS